LLAGYQRMIGVNPETGRAGGRITSVPPPVELTPLSHRPGIACRMLVGADEGLTVLVLDGRRR
jgi:hypothetical protein